jgi:hypothetical protein
MVLRNCRSLAIVLACLLVPLRPAMPLQGTRIEVIIKKISTPNGPIAALAQGTLKLGGEEFAFNSGGFGRGYLPLGIYRVKGPEDTKQFGMVAARNTPEAYGYKFFLSDKRDPRLPGSPLRELLRVHPDEPPPGSHGCIAIIGDPKIQHRFHDALGQLIKSSSVVEFNVSYRP